MEVLGSNLRSNSKWGPRLMQTSRTLSRRLSRPGTAESWRRTMPKKGKKEKREKNLGRIRNRIPLRTRISRRAPKTARTTGKRITTRATTKDSGLARDGVRHREARVAAGRVGTGHVAAVGTINSRGT